MRAAANVAQAGYGAIIHPATGETRKKTAAGARPDRPSCAESPPDAAAAGRERENPTLGHEAVGIVESVGPGGERTQPGDRVVVGAITPCFRRDNCQRGYTSQCREVWGSA